MYLVTMIAKDLSNWRIRGYMAVRGSNEDLKDKVFGQLTVLYAAPSRWEGEGIRYYWIVKCSCGTVFEIRGAALKYGNPDKKCWGCSCKERQEKRRGNARP